jgi:hypothetical protein
MDRAMLFDHLALAERHISQGERHVRRQRELVAQLSRDGHDIAQARSLLTQFEEMLALHKADRDRLLRELQK